MRRASKFKSKKGWFLAHGFKGFQSRVDWPCGIEPVVTHHSRNTGQSKTTHFVDRKQKRRKVAQLPGLGASAQSLGLGGRRETTPITHFLKPLWAP